MCPPSGRQPNRLPRSGPPLSIAENVAFVCIREKVLGKTVHDLSVILSELEELSDLVEGQ